MRVLVIGVDGLDPEVVDARRGELPFLAESARFSGGRLSSVFPPDSVPAWATMMTGLGEDEHGVYGHIDYLSQSTPDDSGGFREELRARTFMDAASLGGVASCTVNPFLAYPPWPLEGVMVSGPLGTDLCVQQAGTHEVVLPEAGGPPILGGIEEFPRQHDLRGFIERTEADIKALEAYAAPIVSDAAYELGFVTFLQLDRVQHFLWRFHDQGDVTHPGTGPFADKIGRAYRLIDSACAELARASGASTILVVSDHGHGRRCERVLNVNEILRRAGLLETASGGRRWLSARYWLQRTKIGVLNASWALGMEEQAFALARRLPQKKALKTSSYLHSRSRSLAAASAIGGTNPSGGVSLNAEGVRGSGADPGVVTERVVDLLSGVRLRDGRCPFLWVARREELFEGAKTSDFPEVLFEMIPEYGVGWDLFGSIEGPNVMHRRVSGGHRREGFLGVIGARPAEGISQPRLVDVAPTVLALLDCEIPPHMKGKVFARR